MTVPVRSVGPVVVRGVGLAVVLGLALSGCTFGGTDPAPSTSPVASTAGPGPSVASGASPTPDGAAAVPGGSDVPDGLATGGTPQPVPQVALVVPPAGFRAWPGPARPGWTALVRNTGCTVQTRAVEDAATDAADVRAPSVRALEALRAGDHGTDASAITDVLVTTQIDAGLDRQGVNFVQQDWTTTVAGTPVRVRAIDRSSIVEQFTGAVQMTQAVAYACLGTQIDEAGWASLLDQFRTTLWTSGPEELGVWPPAPDA